MIAAQGSEAWLLERAGFATMSEAATILSKPKKKGDPEALGRRKYKTRLAAERVTGKPMASDFGSSNFDRGHEQEPHARMAYEARTGLLAVEVPFRKHPTFEWVGASPDGEIDDDGAIEIKCVLPHIQIETITAGGVPSEHVAQVQGVLWVTGRRWCDFVSFSPELPGKLSLYIFRIERDEEYIARLQAEVLQFNAEVAELHNRMLKLAA